MLENNSQTGLPVTDLPKGILFIRTIPLYFNHSDGLIIVKISYDKIKNWIANSQNLGTLFILNDQMQIVASNSDQISDRQFPFPPGITDLKQKSGYFKAEFQGNKVYMFMKKSDYTNWTYLSVVPTGLVQKDSHWIGLITFLIGLFVTIILIILSFTGSRKLYSPIDKIYRSLQEGKNTFRGFNELEFVERVMRNMKHQIMAQGRDLKKYYVFQLLHSGITQHEIQEKILGNHPDLHHRNKYIVIVTQINTLNKSRFHESDRELLLFAMMNILEETIPDAIRLSPVVINQSMACVMGLENRSDEEDKKTVLVYVQTAMNKIKQYVGIPVSAGISRPVGDLSQAPYALEEAMNALNYRVKFGNESLMFIEDVEPSSHQFNPVRFPEQLSRQLLDAIKLNDQATIDRSLKEIIQCVLQNQDIHFTDYYTILMRLLSHIIHLHQPDNENATLILNGKSLPRELMDLKTSSEIEKWFKERVIAPVIQFIQEKNDRHSFHITEQIIHLIESEQEPTLDSISLKLNYSPVYLGQIFRKEKGISFSEYIKSHSINRAMELLQNTNQSIQEISVQLNY
ncbi:MAG: hypothetical protein K0R75_252, partial [Paenibacillaceae bacterium]|nr:hypothetical protein [Paenibacillaceae bacterium]